MAVGATAVDDELELVSDFDEHVYAEGVLLLVKGGLHAFTPWLILAELAKDLDPVVLAQTLMASRRQLKVEACTEIA